MRAFEWFVALRYLKSRRGDGFISVIAGFSLVGITLGVAVLIIVMAVMNGFREELLNRILGLNGHLVVAGYGGELRDYDDLAEDLRQMTGVESVTPLIEGQAMASHNGRSSGAIVRGVAPADVTQQDFIAEGVVTGVLSDFGAPGTLAMGDRLARTLGISAGDTVTLISPRGPSTPFGTAPRMAAYDVAVTFEVGVYDYDNAFVFMPLEDAQVYFSMGDAISGLEVMVQDPDNVRAYNRRISEQVQDVGVVTDWTQINQSLFTALQVERNVMFLILTLIIVVAAFNIISSLIMLVKDKARDVAILRTMGASRASIMRVFIIAGASVGIVGTLLGLVLGVLFTSNIEIIREALQALTGTDLWNPEVRFLSEIPAKMDMGETLATVSIAFLLSFLATLPPSWRAARLDPVDVLRYE